MGDFIKVVTDLEVKEISVGVELSNIYKSIRNIKKCGGSYGGARY